MVTLTLDMCFSLLRLAIFSTDSGFGRSGVPGDPPFPLLFTSILFAFCFLSLLLRCPRFLYRRYDGVYAVLSCVAAVEFFMAAAGGVANVRQWC